MTGQNDSMAINDLIVAPATAPGVGAIAIVRMSGRGALAALDRIFHSETPMQASMLRLGELFLPGEHASIDRCLAVSWRAPHSYTGEDVVELHLHGSPVIVDAAIQACVKSGARLADPGEFTRRAFLNGKLDLAQAEAVSALTVAKTDQARRAALQQLSGGLSAELATIRSAVMDATAELEARVDFPDEDLPAENREALVANLRGAMQKLDALILSFKKGRRLECGARVVLAGPPNAGKSSLFNALVGRERAIVSPHPGTTRDTIEAVVEIAGIPITLVDTAGLRHGAGEIETLGIAKTHEELETADLVLYVIDYRDRNAAFSNYNTVRSLNHLVIFNKAEHLVGVLIGGIMGFEAGPAAGRHGIQFISAKERRGLDSLERAIVGQLAGEGLADDSGVTVTNARHEGALQRARAGLAGAETLLAEDGAVELMIVELRTALMELDSITGAANVDEEILDLIFSRFCLGK